MSESRFLQTVMFGGYERSSVEKRFEYLDTQVFSLKNELRETKLLLAELRKGTGQSKAFDSILDGERAKLTQVQVQHDLASKKLKTAEEELAARDDEIKSLKEKIAALEEDLRDKTMRLTSYEAKSDAEALSAVFIEAQKSAKLLVDTAQKDASELMDNSKKLADNMIAEANNTVQKMIYDAEKETTEKVTDAENRSAKMETATNNMRAVVLADVERLAKQVSELKKVFDHFQNEGINALAEAETVLTETETSLKTGGVPEFIQPNLKETAQIPEPEYAPVDHQYYTKEEAPAEEEKPQVNEELERLKKMADSIAASPKADVQPAETEPPKSSVPDLAALAAQANALTKGS